MSPKPSLYMQGSMALASPGVARTLYEPKALKNSMALLSLANSILPALNSFVQATHGYKSCL